MGSPVITYLITSGECSSVENFPTSDVVNADRPAAVEPTELLLRESVDVTEREV